jgi:methionyl-tRNA formyltransferase
MRITILANNDLPSNYALHLLTRLLSTHDLRIFLSDRLGKPAGLPQALQDLDAFEQSMSPRYAQSVAARITPGSSNDLTLPGFEEIARITGKSIQTLSTINAQRDFKLYRQSQPDLVISIRYGVILKDAAVNLPPFGVINLHSGLLPDYKGVMATFRAMLNGEVKIGTTLHYIRDSSIDTGPVIGTTRLVVNRQRSYLWHVLNLYTDGCRLIADTVNEISSGVSVNAEDQSATGRYYSFPSEADLDAFSRAGLRLYDMKETAMLKRLYLPVAEKRI